MLPLLVFAFFLYLISCGGAEQMGSRSVLYGAHLWWWHPVLLARAWHTLYGWRRVTYGWDAPAPEIGPAVIAHYDLTTSLFDPRLWIAFFVHDLGYAGKPNMDGVEGEEHPVWGATLMGDWFGREWYTFTLCHSRYKAKALGLPYSPLCVADKLAITFEWRWFYLVRVRATGEIAEYRRLDIARAAVGEHRDAMRAATQKNADVQWFEDMCTYLRAWCAEHKDGRHDTWTVRPDALRAAVTESGVWK